MAVSDKGGPARPVRVLISKIGLDGHDRGAKLIVQNLRDAGMEVIYTGLWQTPASTVHAALQEDVDVLGVSLLSAAHMTLMPEVIRLCREAGIGDTPVVVGGIIPEQDKQPLLDAGCGGVFTPGTPTGTIVESITRLAQERRERRERLTVASLPDIRTPAGLARAITLAVEGRFGARGSSSEPVPTALRVGVTGAPGVGKSTFIGRLARQLLERGHRIAVIAVDPTSPITGGSLLGDRLRMMQSEPQDGLFVRSLSSAGAAGGLAPHCDDVATLCAAGGYDVILIETVGAGQGDVEVRRLASEVLLLLMPGAGDAVQFDKAGIVEIATGFVVNKADLPGADRTLKDLRESVGDTRPIWSVCALRGEGFEPIAEWLEGGPRPAV
jgi:LAO/AO transport system ATPase